jgi:hypothetical protein
MRPLHPVNHLLQVLDAFLVGGIPSSDLMPHAKTATALAEMRSGNAVRSSFDCASRVKYLSLLISHKGFCPSLFRHESHGCDLMPIGAISPLTLRSPPASGFLQRPTSGFETRTRFAVENIRLNFAKSHLFRDTGTSAVQKTTSVIRTISDQSAHFNYSTVVKRGTGWSHTDSCSNKLAILGGSNAELGDPDRFVVSV